MTDKLKDNQAEPMTPEEIIQLQQNLLLEAGDTITGLESTLTIFQNVNRAQAGMIKTHLATIQTQRAALEAVSEWLLPIVAYSISCGRSDLEDDDAERWLREGYACWRDDDPQIHHDLRVWMQIWQALNPGREFRPLEAGGDV